MQLHCVLLHHLLISLNQIIAERKELKCDGLMEHQNTKVVCFKKKSMKAVDKSSKIDRCMKSFKSIDIKVKEVVRNSS